MRGWKSSQLSEQGQQDTLRPEIRELVARLDAPESRMERNEAGAERRPSEVLNTIRDAMEITPLRARIARLEANSNPLTTTD